MNIAVIIITVLMHLILTGMAFFILKTVMKSNPSVVLKSIFAIMGVRFVFPLAFYAACLFGWKDYGWQLGEIKTFTILYLALYLLFLAIDTVYFYFTLKNSDKNNKEEK